MPPTFQLLVHQPPANVVEQEADGVPAILSRDLQCREIVQGFKSSIL